MKTPSILHGACLLMMSASVTYGQQPAAKPKPEIRDAPTHEELAQKLRSAQASDPISNFTTEPGAKDPTKENQPVDILEDSDIISFNGLTTLVPKRAILAMPDSFKSRVGKHVAGHRFVVWKDFQIANRGWISTIEVTRTQAEGRTPLGEESLERISKAGTLIVATYQGGPISVLPAREPKVEEAADQPVEGAP